MRLHRFFIDPDSVDLADSVSITDPGIISQWLKVFRHQVGDKVVLFNGRGVEAEYEISRIGKTVVTVEHIKLLPIRRAERSVYLFFSMLKKDKNEWVLQKCTELGVTNFVPIIASRSQKTGFNFERANKIIIEASEQCGRSDIAELVEPMTLAEAIKLYQDDVDMYVCDEHATDKPSGNRNNRPKGVLVGPEGGWTDDEFRIFELVNITGLSLSGFTLRAETACIISTSSLV